MCVNFKKTGFGKYGLTSQDDCHKLFLLYLFSLLMQQGIF